MKKKKVALLFGGKSAEHEVSLRSAKNIAEAIDKEKYDVVLIGIDKSGRWLLEDTSKKLLGQEEVFALNASSDAVAFVPESGGEVANLTRKNSGEKIDVVFPILHGPFGEDGTIQGLLKLANVPFVGAGVLGSAVGMDKDVMKRLLRDAGIRVAKFLAIRDYEDSSFASVSEVLGSPVFVKPANLGSSVGISKVHNEQEFTTALAEAFRFDRKVIIEEFVPGREIECAVLGNDNPVASIPGEVIPHSEFYSYEAKYVDENGAALEIPAQLPEEIVRAIQEIAVRTFKVLSCEGMGRVDFFLKENGEIYVNEINTIPGFTNISMYPKMWEASGISYSELIDKLIELAIERFKKERLLKTNYDSDLSR
jgi:D-alanine-D-alanine ligase